MRLRRAAASLLTLGIVLAACGTGAGSTVAPAVSPSPAASAAASSGGGGRYDTPSASAEDRPSAAPSAAAATLEVQLLETPLGEILGDGPGRTLYVFTADTGGVSTCYAGCDANWPPLASTTVPTLGQGLDPEDFSLVPRTDGTMQVAFFRMPLYFFAGDTGPGQMNGQGLGGKWFVVDGSGTLVGR